MKNETVNGFVKATFLKSVNDSTVCTKELDALKTYTAPIMIVNYVQPNVTRTKSEATEFLRKTWKKDQITNTKTQKITHSLQS